MNLKTQITKLAALLATAAEIQARLGELKTSLASLARRRDEVIEKAAGPDDRKALDELAVLAAQEQLAAHQLKIAERERDGLQARLLAESVNARDAATTALRNHRAAARKQLENALAASFPDAGERAKAIDSLRPIPPALFATQRASSALHGVHFTPAGGSGYTTETGFAEAILGAAQRAVDLIEA